MLEGTYSLNDVLYYGYMEHPVLGRCIWGQCMIKDHDIDSVGEFGFMLINAFNETDKEDKQVKWERDISIDHPTCGDADPREQVPEEAMEKFENHIMMNVKYINLEVTNGHIVRGGRLQKMEVNLVGSHHNVAVIFFFAGALVGFIAKVLF